VDDRDDPARRRALRRYGADLAASTGDPAGGKEQRKSAKARGAAKRQSAQPRAARFDPHDEEALELLPGRERHGGRRSEEIGRRAAQLQEGDTERAAGAAQDLLPGEAMVVAITRGQCEVELDGETLVCHLPKALTEAQRSELAVGDRLRVARRPAGDLVAAQVLPRANRLSRPDPFLGHRERVLAANLDLAVVVVSLRKPPLTVGLVDRFLVALAHGGVPAAIAVNKVDLADDAASDPELLQLASYERLGVPVVRCSVRSGSGIDELARLLAGRTAVFVGHSGVGKSSLLRAIAPDFDVQVGEVSTGNARGRHTTSRSRVYRLPDGVTRIVDTPGIREFGLWRMTPRDLGSYFDDLAELAPDCRFTDCSHTHEPGCAVRLAVEENRLDPERYATYARILASLGDES
jgi:ribosome biogenesis GTPase